jgi:hypothetical protein
VKERYGILNRKLTKKEVGAVNRDIVVFVFFLFLSFGFWYINSLGKEVEADIKCPVKYINLPKERVITEVPEKVNLYLKGPGYSILKFRVSGKKPALQIDLSKASYKHVPESKSGDYYIVTSGLIKSFTFQIRTGCEVMAIKPDTLFFTLTKALTR